MKRFVPALCAMLLSLSLGAQQIKDIDISVVIGKDGSATVTQKWDIEVTRGTEWYLPIGNLGPMTVGGLEVYENGTAFESVGDRWQDRKVRHRAKGQRRRAVLGPW